MQGHEHIPGNEPIPNDLKDRSERPADPAGETKDATLKLSSGLFVQYEEYAKLEAQLVASQAECERLTKTLAQIRSGVESTPPSPAPHAVREKLVTVLQAASHALRSYQYGNSSEELAESMADAIDAALAESAGKGE